MARGQQTSRTSARSRNRHRRASEPAVGLRGRREVGRGEVLSGWGRASLPGCRPRTRRARAIGDDRPPEAPPGAQRLDGRNEGAELEPLRRPASAHARRSAGSPPLRRSALRPRVGCSTVAPGTNRGQPAATARPTKSWSPCTSRRSCRGLEDRAADEGLACGGRSCGRPLPGRGRCRCRAVPDASLPGRSGKGSSRPRDRSKAAPQRLARATAARLSRRRGARPTAPFRDPCSSEPRTVARPINAAAPSARVATKAIAARRGSVGGAVVGDQDLDAAEGDRLPRQGVDEWSSDPAFGPERRP